MFVFNLARDWPLIAAPVCLALSAALSVRDRIRRNRRALDAILNEVTS